MDPALCDRRARARFVVLLAGSGVRMLSVDIFLWTVTGRQEAASVLALIQTPW